MTMQNPRDVTDLSNNDVQPASAQRRDVNGVRASLLSEDPYTMNAVVRIFGKHIRASLSEGEGFADQLHS
jgi:hypothetical protein